MFSELFVLFELLKLSELSKLFKLSELSELFELSDFTIYFCSKLALFFVELLILLEKLRQKYDMLTGFIILENNLKFIINVYIIYSIFIYIFGYKNIYLIL